MLRVVLEEAPKMAASLGTWGSEPPDDSSAGTAAFGLDHVDLARFEEMLARHGSALTHRVFTARERAEAAGRPRHLAARLAAKEAASKALGAGIGTVRWHDVQVLADASGRPSVHLSGPARDRADQLGLTRWLVSLSHTSSTAVALVAASREVER